MLKTKKLFYNNAMECNLIENLKEIFLSAYKLFVEEKMDSKEFDTFFDQKIFEFIVSIRNSRL